MVIVHWMKGLNEIFRDRKQHLQSTDRYGGNHINNSIKAKGRGRRKPQSEEGTRAELVIRAMV